MTKFLVYLCIAIVVMYLVFQAAIALMKLVFVLATLIAIAAGVFLLYQAVTYFFKKRQA